MVNQQHPRCEISLDFPAIIDRALGLGLLITVSRVRSPGAHAILRMEEKRKDLVPSSRDVVERATLPALEDEVDEGWAHACDDGSLALAAAEVWRCWVRTGKQHRLRSSRTRQNDPSIGVGFTDDLEKNLFF